MEWLELIVHTTTAGADPVSCILIDSGAEGTLIEDRADIPDPAQPHGIWEIIDPSLLENMPEDVLVHAWFAAGVNFPGLIESVQYHLSELSAKHSDFGSLRLRTQTVNDDSWNDVWKKGFRPFRAGKHLVIKPSWEPYESAPGDLIIEIDPGMAFGSGTHETTGMCLSLLEETVSGGEEVIDVGTGSGILAIGAALLGAARVLATDIDPDAVKVASENARSNHVETVVSVRQADLLDNVPAVCDICVANIIADIIISSASRIREHIRPGGLFICSGIVSSRDEAVSRALTAAGFRILRKETRGEWVAFLCGRID